MLRAYVYFCCCCDIGSDYIFFFSQFIMTGMIKIYTAEMAPHLAYLSVWYIYIYTCIYIFLSRKNKLFITQMFYCLKTAIILVVDVSSQVKKKQNTLKTLKIHLETCLVQQKFVRSQKQKQKQKQKQFSSVNCCWIGLLLLWIWTRCGRVLDKFLIDWS